MSKRANPAAIGLFILLGLALGVGGLILFGSSKLFSHRQKFVLYFDASVKGLNPGAPVKFRGVTVGAVVEVRIRLNQAEEDLTIPVIIEVDAELVREKTDRAIDLADEERLQAAVDQGLRGLLEAQSILTGLLYIELEYVANAPAPVFHQLSKVYPEIPTTPTHIEELMANIVQMDLKGVTDKLNDVLGKLDASLGQLQMSQINQGVTNLLSSLNRIATSPDLSNVLASANRTLDEVRSLSENLRATLGPLAANADQTMKDASVTLAELNGGVRDVRDMLAPHAPLRRQLLEVMEDLDRAARSITGLAEFLNQNPQALISGRKRPE